jgi:hypothetical protein
MKLIITENRINNLMIKYLESLINEKSILHMYPYIIIYDNSDRENPIELMNFDRTNGRMWIRPKFINLFDTLFGRGHLETIDFFKNWFENEFGVKSMYQVTY